MVDKNNKQCPISLENQSVRIQTYVDVSPCTLTKIKEANSFCEGVTLTHLQALCIQNKQMALTHKITIFLRIQNNRYGL